MKRPVIFLLAVTLTILFVATMGTLGWSVTRVFFLLFFAAMLALSIRFFHLLTRDKYNDAA